jgi:hypothetical protein
MEVAQLTGVDSPSVAKIGPLSKKPPPRA